MVETGRLLVGIFILGNTVLFLVGAGVFLLLFPGEPMGFFPRMLAELDVPISVLAVAVGVTLLALLLPVAMGVWLLVTGLTSSPR